MNVIEMAIPEVKLIEPTVFKDDRGFFMESYHQDKLKEQGIQVDFVQDNHSLSQDRGIIRGLHYQKNPMAQAKLIKAVTGAIYDVAVDIREGSPTFGHWVWAVLSEDNHHMMLIPKGFAHGFCTLTHQTHVLYKVDAHYSPQDDRGIRWDDPDISVEWPTHVPILSDKDVRQPMLKQADIDFHYENPA